MKLPALLHQVEPGQLVHGEVGDEQIRDWIGSGECGQGLCRILESPDLIPGRFEYRGCEFDQERFVVHDKDESLGIHSTVPPLTLGRSTGKLVEPVATWG